MWHFIMNEDPGEKSKQHVREFSHQVDKKVTRKLKAQRHVRQGVWYGLGMMGLVGWSVAVPTLLGVTLGLWIDKHYSGRHSWTLMLLVVGLGLGCFNAWHWIVKEEREIREQEENAHD